MYWLELAGEEDAFAAAEAATAATSVELLAPGIAQAGVAGDGVERLAYTRAAHEAIGRTDADVDAAAALLRAAPLDRTGSIAVRARNVRNTTDVSTSAVERELGDVLVDRGFSVDLDDPDHVLRALFAAGERPVHDAVAGADGEAASLCTLGWVAHEADREFAPRPTDRPFFQPGSMAPVDARAYVNLAGAAPGRTILDPMCGTGGLPLEAGLVGSDVVACDAQAKMVHGTRRNLRAYLGTDSDGPDGPCWHVVRADATALPIDGNVGDTGGEPFDGNVADPDGEPLANNVGSEPLGDTGGDGLIDGVVFDAPYGRQSKIARHELADLLVGALSAAARVAPRAVLVADRDWRMPAREAGWSVTATFERRVHRSLTRHVMVLQRHESAHSVSNQPGR